MLVFAVMQNKVSYSAEKHTQVSPANCSYPLSYTCLTCYFWARLRWYILPVL